MDNKQQLINDLQVLNTLQQNTPLTASQRAQVEAGLKRLYETVEAHYPPVTSHGPQPPQDSVKDTDVTKEKLVP
jgi:hypothetical protein